MTDARYKLSFTAGGLLVSQATIAVDYFSQSDSWAQVRSAIEQDNALQARTVSTGMRLAREVTQRLSELRTTEITLLAEGTQSERCALMWVAACRRYEFLSEFAEEVVRERFLLMTPTLNKSDFDSFLASKSLWHQELADLSESTRRKLRSNLFLMLRQAGMLTNSSEILQVVLTERMRRLLSAEVPSDVRLFPTNEVGSGGLL